MNKASKIHEAIAISFDIAYLLSTITVLTASAMLSQPKKFNLQQVR
jgi:hypothetical protein